MRPVEHETNMLFWYEDAVNWGKKTIKKNMTLIEKIQNNNRRSIGKHNECVCVETAIATTLKYTLPYLAVEKSWQEVLY